MLDTIILVNLIENEEYLRKVLPFIKEEYFSDNEHKFAFNKIKDYVEKYNTAPTVEALSVSYGTATDEDVKLLEKIFF